MRPKTCRYSEQQIREAIEFWTQILENKSPFLDRLITDFGYDAVFRKDTKMSFRIEDIKNIAHIADDVIFANSLSELRFHEDKYGKFTSQDVPFGYNYFTYDDQDTGKRKLLTTPIYDNSGSLIYDSPVIYVSSQFLISVKFHLITMSSIVVHELIHQYIVESASSDELSELDRNISVEAGHNAKFKKTMSDINAKFGLNVTVSGSSTYDDDSYVQMKKFTGSDYDINEEDKDKKISENHDFNSKYASRTQHKSGFIEITLH